MASATARKAWNDAMKQTAGAALPPSLQRTQKRRSDRHKKQDRRSKARKATANNGGVGGSLDNDEFRTAVWVDALEGVDPAVAVQDDDDEYDELEEYQEEKKRKRSRSSKSQKKTGGMSKRFLPRSLGSILVEEANRGEDGSAREFLACVAKVPKDQQPLPRRKLCPVTGILAVYVEPKSGIPYASMTALEQIQERSPPWMSLGGAAAFHEAVKSIEDDS